MSAQVLIFGHGAPLSDPVLAGLALRDVTRLRHEGPPASRIAPLLEPFLDPFTRSFLFGLESRAFDGAACLVIWRQGAGALHAFRYAAELRRLRLLPDGPPLHLWNRVGYREGAASPAAALFDHRQDARLADALAPLPRGAPLDRDGPLAMLEARQAAGEMRGALAFARRLTARAQGLPVDPGPGPLPQGARLALAGSPLGGTGLHDWLDRQGALVLDLQGPDAPPGAVESLLVARGVEGLVWQVDPHDDLHGWHKPRLQALCVRLGIRFADLGFVPSWPTAADLPEALP